MAPHDGPSNDRPSDHRARDEDLPAPAGWSPRRTRLVIALAVVLVLALAAVAIDRLATRSTSHAGPATVTVPPSSKSASATTAPNHTRPPGLTEPPDVLAPLRRLGEREIETARANCPRLAPSCTTTGETPSAVISALRASYPGVRELVAVSDIAYSDTSGPRLAYRLVSARDGRLVIVVEIRQTRSGDGVGSVQQFGDSHVYRTQTVAAGLTIEVQVSVPPRVTLRAGPMTKLVDNEGVRAIG